MGSGEKTSRIEKLEGKLNRKEKGWEDEGIRKLEMRVAMLEEEIKGNNREREKQGEEGVYGRMKVKEKWKRKRGRKEKGM